MNKFQSVRFSNLGPLCTVHAMDLSSRHWAQWAAKGAAAASVARPALMKIYFGIFA